MKRGTKPRPASERFWPMVQKTDGCWLWTGMPTNAGYGGFNDGGTERRAHRFAYREAGGEIRGVVVGHTCDTRLCVRNDEAGVYVVDGVEYPRFGHLFGAPDRKANNRDMYEKGRHQHGAKNGHTRLTDDDVRLIRAEVAAGTPQKILAEKFGLSPGAMSQIIHRLTWKHVS